MIRRMFLVYEILLWIVFVGALPWFLVVGLVRGKYLSTARERFGRHDAARSRNDLWIQTVSVGETVAARTIVSAIQRKRPDLSIVVTTTTITGQEMARKLFPNCRVAYFPFDFSRSVRRFLDHFNPSVYVTVKTEIWPNVSAVCGAPDPDRSRQRPDLRQVGGALPVCPRVSAAESRALQRLRRARGNRSGAPRRHGRPARAHRSRGEREVRFRDRGQPARDRASHSRARGGPPDRGHGIMGASGSGKSTFMNILGFLDQPSRGQYLLEGINGEHLSRDELAEIRNQ